MRSLFLVLLSLGTALGAPTLPNLPSTDHIERRFGPIEVHARAQDAAHEGLVKRSLDPTEMAAYAFKLHARDQARINALIAELANPEHENYGQWLSMDEAHEATKSDPHGVSEILSYLELFGLGPEHVVLEHGNRTISFHAETSVANALFGADFGTFSHGGVHKRATSSIALPRSLHKYIARTEPGIDVRPVYPRRRNEKRKLSDEENNQIRSIHQAMQERYEQDPPSEAESRSGNTPANLSGSNNTNALGGAVAEPGQPIGPSLSGALSQCWQYYFPLCLKAQYHLPSQIVHTAGTSIGSLNIKPECTNPSDVTTAWEYYQKNIYQANPSYLPTHIDITIPGIPTAACGGNSQGYDNYAEPNLDIQTIAPLVYPMQYYDYSAPNENYLASIYSAVQGMGSNGVPKPDVLSVSYGYYEPDTDLGTWQSFCQQTDAIILTGTTLVCSSGDRGDQDMQYPALCPHWVAVGATDINDGETVTSPSYAEQYNDNGWKYAGSGGFSEQGAPAPSWQISALASYAAQYVSTNFAAFQKNAAPDVAAMGRNYPIVTSGFGQLYGGTSLSSPIWGSLFAMINANRVAQSKGLVGFPLPALYANPQLFRDVTLGSNNEANNNGEWPAKNGWDPATGLGTPLYDRLSAFFQSAATGTFKK